MKNSLITVTELFGPFTPNMLASVTLGCCYDHIREEYTLQAQDEIQVMQHNDYENPVTQEIE